MAWIIPTVPASPGSVLDYGLDLSAPATQLNQPWLAPGEQIVSLSCVADPGVVVNSYGYFTNASGVPAALCVAWLSGFAAGQSYNVHFTFTTNQGRTDTRSITVQCAAR